MTMIRINNGFRTAIVNPFGDVAQFVLTAVEVTGEGAKIMLAEVDGVQVWDHLPIRGQNQDHTEEFLLDLHKRDFFGAALAGAFQEAAHQPETKAAASALDALGPYCAPKPQMPASLLPTRGQKLNEQQDLSALRREVYLRLAGVLNTIDELLGPVDKEDSHIA